MKKMSGKSLDLLEKNIDIIRKTFPEVMTEEEFNGKVERKIDFDKLRLLLGDDVSDREERYELRWNGKNDAIRLAQKPFSGTLRPDKESSKNWYYTGNLYIEGDNLKTLKLIQKAYFNKVKVIYIDPPYNTGKDFIYKDNFKDTVETYIKQTGQEKQVNTETNGRYHTNWINMMYPRLKVARNLLKEDGVIFISIDETEVANLRKICDEIFGEDNFITNIIWEKKFSPQNDAKYFSINHDNILCYTKSKNEWERKLLPMTEEQKSRYKNPDNDTRGKWQSDNLSAARLTEKDRYEIITPSGRKVMPPEGASWRVSKERFKELVEDNRIWFGENGDNVPRIKRFLREVQNGRVPISIWYNKEVGHTQSAKQNLKKLFNNKDYFDTPKSVELIKRMLYISSSEDDIVMDFFSGSATTAHAVMQLNAEDGGNRKFIMVQIPELTSEKSDAFKDGYENICEIGKERIRRAGDMIVNENKDKEGIEDLDIGFKVFKLDSSNIKEWDPDYENLEYSLFERQDIIKMGRTNEDLLYEIIIKMGIEPTVGIEEIKFGEKTIYNIGMGALLICLEDEITKDLVAEIPNHKSIIDEMDTKVVFKESGFRTDSAKMNAIQKLKQFGITDVRSV